MKSQVYITERNFNTSQDKRFGWALRKMLLSFMSESWSTSEKYAYVTFPPHSW